jgi:NAD+ diphosphatase
MRRTRVPHDQNFKPVPASRANVYTGSPLDRVAERRADAAFIATALASPKAIVAPVWRSQNLFHEQRARFFPTKDALGWESDPQRWLFLGLWGERPLFALDLGHHDAPQDLLPENHGDFADIRSIGGLLPAGEASVLAYARGLIHWQGRTRFCGVCGNPCLPASAGHVMHCTGCGADHFPRSDPAVIMLVVRHDSILMGHASRFPEGMYSTLAGFVEPGESLEEAVRREVYEETGVRVGAVAYHSSQPWPFPSSLMLGFYGEGLTEEIEFRDAELADARWFTRAMCRDPEAHGFKLPGGDSIARRLVEDWLAAG